MGIFNKKKETKVEKSVDEKLVPEVRSKRFTYVDIASRELNGAVAPLEAEVKELETKLNAALEMRTKNPSSLQYIEFIKDIRTKIEVKTKNLDKVRIQNKVDQNLMNLAISLDQSLVHGAALGLYKQLDKNLTEASRLTNSILTLYGGTGQAPVGICVMRESLVMHSINNIRSDIKFLKEVDRENLTLKFNARLKELAEMKKEKESINGVMESYGKTI
jgi:hypothetical protein